MDPNIDMEDNTPAGKTEEDFFKVTDSPTTSRRKSGFFSFTKTDSEDKEAKQKEKEQKKELKKELKKQEEDARNAKKQEQQQLEEKYRTQKKAIDEKRKSLSSSGSFYESDGLYRSETKTPRAASDGESCLSGCWVSPLTQGVVTFTPTMPVGSSSGFVLNDGNLQCNVAGNYFLSVDYTNCISTGPVDYTIQVNNVDIDNTLVYSSPTIFRGLYSGCSIYTQRYFNVGDVLTFNFTYSTSFQDNQGRPNMMLRTVYLQ